MVQTLRYALALAITGAVAFGWTVGCSSTSGGGPSPGPDAAGGGKSPEAGTDSSTTKADGQAPSDAATSYTYVLIDDMETTTHGPIELDAGINPPLTPGYWFNFGASVCGDTASPPMTEFTFTALPSPTTTHDGKVSMHAGHQQCGLLGQYDVCGIGLEFAQMTDLDAGTTTAAASTCDAAPAGNATAADGATQDAGRDGGDAASDGGDAGPPIPKVTVPFDVSQYKGIVFWAKATVAGDAGSLAIKVQFPDTDTDPRGGVCNSSAAGAAGPADTTACYNSYAIQQEMVTGEWQQFTVLYTDLMIATDFGYQDPSPFNISSGGDAGDAGTAGSTKVYGINWQAQKNSVNDGGLEIEDFWVDDVYFIK